MTTYTVTETVTHALRRAGLLGDDETPTAEQLALATKTYNSRLQGLQVRGFRLWGWTSSAVPLEFFDPLADYIALFLIATAGGPRQPDAGTVLTAEITLRQLGTTEPTYDVIAGTYF